MHQSRKEMIQIWAIAASDVPAPNLANRVDEHSPSMNAPLIALRQSCKIVGLNTLNIVPTRNSDETITQ